MRRPRALPFRALAVSVTAAVAWFARGQNRSGRAGGRISLPKALWLNYTLLSWFVFPAALLRHPGMSAATRRTLAAHLASFGARGAAELWMLYRTRSWRVAYGVGHDLFDLALLSVLLGRNRPLGSADRLARRHLDAVRGTLVAEIVFALAFHRAVAGRTYGDGAIYFASEGAEFHHINRLTAAVDGAAYLHLVRTAAAMMGTTP